MKLKLLMEKNISKGTIQKLLQLVHQNQCLNQKNTIDPENIIFNYGADAARLFILSDSPPEKDVQWSEEGINHHLNLSKNCEFKF